MEDFLDIPTLIVIGLAIVVLVRLRSVLGTRTGNERNPLERRAPANKPAAEEKVVPMRPRPAAEPVNDGDAERRALKLAAEIEAFSAGNTEIASGLKAINEADPNF